MVRQVFDGVVYRRTMAVDPRFLVPGLMLLLVSVPVVVMTWPIRLGWSVPGVAVLLVVVGLVKRQYFEVSKGMYRIGWALGPVRWVKELPSGSVSWILITDATCTLLMRARFRKFDPLMETDGRAEGEAWVAFFKSVAAGEGGRLPGEL